MNIEIIMAILGFAGAFLVKEAWDFIKAKGDKQSQFIDKALEKNTEAISQLQIAIVELKIRIEHLSEKLTPVPKLSKDMNEVHAKIRELRVRVEGNGTSESE